MQTNNIALADLRIGNIISSWRFKNDELTVLEIGSRSIKCRWIRTGLPRIIFIDDLSGIPITEEWLERLGFSILPFEEYTTYEHTTMAAVRLEKELDGYWLQIHHLNNHGEEEYVICSNFCEFVHELQNCFYFLTGTELTLK